MNARLRFRFSLRTLFVVVTLAAGACGFGGWLWNRSAEFRMRAASHEMKAMRTMAWKFHTYPTPPNWQQLVGHHEHLQRKYAEAARYPWLPVEADPPEPTR